LRRLAGRLGVGLSRAREHGSRGGALELLTVVALLGGTLMILAEFLDVFEIRTAGVVIKQQGGGDQHSYSLLVIGAAVLAATLVARSSEQWPPAAGVMALSVLGLGLILLGDLPDATKTDLVTSGRLASAHPAIGLWVGLAGAAIAFVAGGALTYLLRR
jgi:hypothetical protein